MRSREPFRLGGGGGGGKGAGRGGGERGGAGGGGGKTTRQHESSCLLVPDKPLVFSMSQWTPGHSIVYGVHSSHMTNPGTSGSGTVVPFAGLHQSVGYPLLLLQQVMSTITKVYPELLSMSPDHPCIPKFN